MRTCLPSEFVTRWPGSLHPIAVPDPPPSLPEDCRWLLTKFGLPRELTIYCYNDIILRFSGVLVDRPILEICGNDGDVFISSELARRGDAKTVKAFADGTGAKLIDLEVFELNSIWSK
jgi:hypothetical protein